MRAPTSRLPRAWTRRPRPGQSRYFRGPLAKEWTLSGQRAEGPRDPRPHPGAATPEGPGDSRHP